MLSFISKLTEKILNNGRVTMEEASGLMEIKENKHIISLLSFANIIRNEFKGTCIDTCSIINAKSGSCTEDCKFCSQSARYKTGISAYPLISKSEIIKRIKEAGNIGANRVGIVLSGKTIKNPLELEILCDYINILSSEKNIGSCASLGILNNEYASKLREAGLTRYHHNLEAAKGFFHNICSTHSYEDRVSTIMTAREKGFELCSGGIIGMGETPLQRLELAFELRELDVDSIAMNFLNPIPGTPLECSPPLSPMEILKTIAIFRFINPRKDIRICGGRQKNLGVLEAFIYIAGANAVMIGNYLTTPGSNPLKDIEVIKELLLEKAINQK